MASVLNDAEALSAQDELFNAYFDDELSADERTDFDRRLQEDPDFAEEYEHFASFMGGLQNMHFQYAPDDFVTGVQSKIRTRSRGRFFAQEVVFRTRMQYEVVAAIMLIVMATTYLFFGAPNDKYIGDLTVQGSPPTLDQNTSKEKE